MNAFSDFLSRLLGTVIKLVLVLAAAVFVVSFLVAALVVVILVSMWSLVTGRKPAPVVMFTRMREQSQRYAQGVWPGRGAPSGDVVDVEVTEVTEVVSDSAAPGTRGGKASPRPPAQDTSFRSSH